MTIPLKVNWRYIRGAVSILVLALSIFVLFGTSSSNIITSHLETQSPSLYTDLGINRGVHPQIEFGNLLNGLTHPKDVFSSIIPSAQSTRMIIDLQTRFEQISGLTSMIVGPLAYELYKQVRSSQEWKEEGNNRDLIKKTITTTPGITLRGISRVTKIAMGSVQYWVRILEKENEIEIFPLGNSKHFFALHSQRTDEARLLYSLIQNRRIYEILQCLNDNPTINTQTDLCKNLGVHKALISYYIKILKNHHIIDQNMRMLSISTIFKRFLT